MDMPDYIFKLIIVGDSFTGKTSLLNKSCYNTFTERYDATIGVDFITKLNNMSDGSVIKTHIWDTAGQRCFSSILKEYYKNSAGIIYVFDKGNKKSFENIKYWMNEVKGNIKTPSILIGNKIDKSSNVSREVAENFALENGMSYIETSASMGINTDDFLDTFITDIYNNIDGEMVGININTNTSIKVKKKEETNCCCNIS
jgi:small GTP-binding protein